jgi:hypothetical protein
MRVEKGIFTLSKAELGALLAFCSDDPMRQHIYCLCFDLEKRRILATTGQIALIVQDGTGGDPVTKTGSFLLGRENAQTVYKIARVSDPIRVGRIESGSRGIDVWIGSTRMAFSCWSPGQEYPPVDAVIPDYEGRASAAAEFGVDVELLNRLRLVQKAAGSKGIRIRHGHKPLDLLLATPIGQLHSDQTRYTAVLCPARL